ncbi:MAG: copper-binding protein [Xanthobacteraceae bacterium]|nr:copper-binding protein [Xanthobacteraceae bacterium]
MRKRMLPIAAAMAIVAGLSTSVLAQADLVDAEVTKIDEAASKITLKHGPLKKFDMDGMTMVFRVPDPAMLKQVKVGDKVKFEADKINGQFTVVKMQKAK